MAELAAIMTPTNGQDIDRTGLLFESAVRQKVGVFPFDHPIANERARALIFHRGSRSYGCDRPNHPMLHRWRRSEWTHARLPSRAGWR